MNVFFNATDALREALDPRVTDNIAGVQARTEPYSFALKLQIKRAVDGEKMTLTLPADLFHASSDLGEVLRQDETALAKLILFLA